MCCKTSWVACASCLAMAMAGAEVRSQEEPAAAYSVEELVAALSEQLTSIDSLYCEYSVKYSNEERSVSRRFARSGVRWNFTELSTKGLKTGEKENTTCFDDDHNVVFAYVVERRQGGLDDWSTVEIHDPKDQGNLDPDLLLGVKLSNVSRSIVDVLASSNVTKSEAKLPDGTAGVRLIARAVQSALSDADGVKFDVAVTLDPKRGFLPVDILITENENTITAPGFAQHWKVLEFRRVLDERTGRERWFPVSGVMTPGSLVGMPTVRIDVDKVQVNSSLSDTLFSPSVPDGTQVADLTSDGRGERFIKGGDYAVIERMKDLKGLSTSALEPGRSGRLWLVAVNCLFIVILVLWLLRRVFPSRFSNRKER